MWNHEEWNHCRDLESRINRFMDIRHVRFIYDLVMSCDFNNILEIGPNNGWTTSAFIQARKDGKSFNLTVCDISVRETLSKLVRNWFSINLNQGGRIRVEECNSIYLPNKGVYWPDFDLVLIDGNHSINQVSREFGLCLYHETPTILAHDTGGTIEKPTVDKGPVFMKYSLENNNLYKVLNDEKTRENEETHRGFMIATRDEKVFEKANQSWKDMISMSI